MGGRSRRAEGLLERGDEVMWRGPVVVVVLALVTDDGREVEVVADDIATDVVTVVVIVAAVSAGVRIMRDQY